MHYNVFFSLLEFHYEETEESSSGESLPADFDTIDALLRPYIDNESVQDEVSINE
jgi:hypothetical protein